MDVDDCIKCKEMLHKMTFFCRGIASDTSVSTTNWVRLFILFQTTRNGYFTIAKRPYPRASPLELGSFSKKYFPGGGPQDMCGHKSALFPVAMLKLNPEKDRFKRVLP
jgi:hypothetical protein